LARLPESAAPFFLVQSYMHFSAHSNHVSGTAVSFCPCVAPICPPPRYPQPHTFSVECIVFLLFKFRSVFSALNAKFCDYATCFRLQRQDFLPIRYRWFPIYSIPPCMILYSHFFLVGAPADIYFLHFFAEARPRSHITHKNTHTLILSSFHITFLLK
jgi:hypothetical protein